MSQREPRGRTGSRTGQRRQSGGPRQTPQRGERGSSAMGGQYQSTHRGGHRQSTYNQGGQRQGGQHQTESRQGGHHQAEYRQGGQLSTGFTLEESLPQIYMEALEDFEHAVSVCEWCADQCLDEPHDMAECIRLCRDVTDVGTLGAKFVARDSYFVEDVAEIFAEVAAECADECARHEHEHCQDCARVLDRAVDTAWDLLDRTGHQTGGFQQTVGQHQLSQY